MALPKRISLTYDDVMRRLHEIGQPESLAGMAHFGIVTTRALGISIATLRNVAKEIGRDHTMAQQLWASGVHEARILATLVDDPTQVTETQMDAWVRDINSWDVCDACCLNLFDKTPYAWDKAMQWSTRDEEFVKRAGFALMAGLAWHDKKAADTQFAPFLERIIAGAPDDRNFVRKAVNWALRQIGKRNDVLRRRAIETAEQILASGDRSASLVARDALRELRDEH